MTLIEASQRLGLSERWIRRLIRRHGLSIRTIPYAGGYKFVFTGGDLKRICAIHERNQLHLKRQCPEFFRVVGKIRRGPVGTDLSDIGGQGRRWNR
jgi:hypothetical protein